METSQFEAKKIALKQTKDGHVLNLAIHPDEIPEEILRDFVGARYMVVMVRLADTEIPMIRAEEYAGARLVKQAGMLCRELSFCVCPRTTSVTLRSPKSTNCPLRMWCTSTA